LSVGLAACRAKEGQQPSPKPHPSSTK
jgi:hypothetical protein